jgi:hypothetical protein
VRVNDVVAIRPSHRRDVAVLAVDATHSFELGRRRSPDGCRSAFFWVLEQLVDVSVGIDPTPTAGGEKRPEFVDEDVVAEVIVGEPKPLSIGC